MARNIDDIEVFVDDLNMSDIDVVDFIDEVDENNEIFFNNDIPVNVAIDNVNVAVDNVNVPINNLNNNIPNNQDEVFDLNNIVNNPNLMLPNNDNANIDRLVTKRIKKGKQFFCTLPYSHGNLPVETCKERLLNALRNF